jgi:hypothetical protein
MTYNYERDDPTFVDDLRDSKRAVDAAAAFLNSKGYPVVVRPMFIRPDVSQINDYSDDGDIEIIQRVEVKQRKDTSFSSKADFPYQTLIVDTCRAFDKAKPKPYAYIICNPALTCALVVDVKATRRHWTRVEKNDRKKGRCTEFYECPIASCGEIQLPSVGAYSFATESEAGP